MIDNKVLQALNDQLNFEFYTSNVYLQMSAWAANEGLEGCSLFLAAHSKEELEHMYKLFDYINDRGNCAEVAQIPAPKSNFKNVVEMFDELYAQELEATSEINKLAALAFKEADLATFNFLQWFISEQIEEEGLIRHIQDKIKLIGNMPDANYLIDQEVHKLVGKAAV
ncbi:MAG: ferritin [Francisellaceae bacterium]|jgi:ferritin